MNDKRNKDINSTSTDGVKQPSEQQPDLAAVCAKLADATDKLTTMAADLADARRQAAMAGLAKSTFLASLSHELRTPLNAIIGFSDLMKAELHGPLGAESYRLYISDINDSGRLLLSLIDDLLELSRIELGRPVMRERMTDISRLLNSMAALIRDRARTGGIEVATNVDNHLSYIWVDAVKLKQAVMHLLDNAVKFTEPGGKIALLAGIGEDGSLVLQVIDTGIGIAAPDLPKVFETSHLFDAMLTRKHGGVGLGLPLARAIAELHGGQLTIESAPGVGTKVVIFLPRERVLHGPNNSAT